MVMMAAVDPPSRIKIDLARFPFLQASACAVRVHVTTDRDFLSDTYADCACVCHVVVVGVGYLVCHLCERRNEGTSHLDTAAVPPSLPPSVHASVAPPSGSMDTRPSSPLLRPCSILAAAIATLFAPSLT